MPSFDFIVVGAGPAGASLASRVATSGKRPNVLLLEAGGSNNSSSMRLLADRFTTLVTSPEANWNYTTASQKALGDRELSYARGKGLGGSTAINFACWTIGPKDDFDEWARLVGDDSFNWSNVHRRYQELESFDIDISSQYAKYATPKAEDHGSSGPVKVEFAKTWEKSLTDMVDACDEYGLGRNEDINSGNPIGVGICPSTARKSVRWTASSAYLEPAPPNVTIKAGATVAKILFDGSKAVGVQTLAGEQYLATKEVILSAGALDSPKLLMLSGVGPKDQLDRHGIQAVKELSGVGENLIDHCLTGLTVQTKDGLSERPPFYNNPELVDQAREQFLKDGSGPLAKFYSHLTMGFCKNEAMTSTPEFQTLSKDVQEHFLRSTVPTWEIITHTPTFSPLEDLTRSYLSALAIGMMPQSRGTVQLASANPADPPIADPNFLSHPFDKRNMIEAVRHVMELFKSPALADHIIAPLHMPDSTSDEDIWAYVQQFAATVWHMSSSVKMGTKDDPTACVDSDFKVFGVENLRVADVSVTPFLPNCHTMSIAYLIGNTAAEKIIAEYSLDN